MRNKLIFILSISIIFGLFQPSVNATFSIVAVDTLTGEVGGAGASCIDNSFIINSLLESVGAVHTQAWWIQANKDNAEARLSEGLTPDSIVGWLTANDVQGRPQLRQYGVVTLAGQGASAGHTGTGTDFYRGHITGPGYAIQGNILLGPSILDSMEYEFLNTVGPLEEKLMAALEAAKVIGADTRCFGSGKSSISAFIKILRPGDGNDPYLEINVANTSGSTDPIDLVRVQFDTWKLLKQADPDLSTISVSPTVLEINSGGTATVTIIPLNSESNPPESPISVSLWNSGTGVPGIATDNGDGSFSALITAGTQAETDSIGCDITAGGIQIGINNQTALTYFICGDMNNTGENPDISDLTFLVDFMFKGGDPPPIMESSDIDGSGGDPNISDLTALVDYMFRGGSAPICQ